jgi:hypothetical protein
MAPLPAVVVTDKAAVLVNSGDVTEVEKAPVIPVKAVVATVPMVPEVVIASAPTSMAPKPAVMEPAPRAPTVVNEERVATEVVTRVPVALGKVIVISEAVLAALTWV